MQCNEYVISCSGAAQHFAISRRAIGVAHAALGRQEWIGVGVPPHEPQHWQLACGIAMSEQQQLASVTVCGWDL